MLPKTSLRRDAFRAIGRTARHSIACCSVLLALASTAITTKGSVATASSEPVPVQIVDRTHKGDRLPLIDARDGKAFELPLQVNAPRTLASSRGLPDGCESLVSSLARSPVAEIAGRCLS
jgi:hypothetical protein